MNEEPEFSQRGGVTCLRTHSTFRARIQVSCHCTTLCVCVCVISHSQLFATPWTVAHQVPLSTGLPLQKYWSGLPFPSPGDIPDPEIEPKSLASPALAGGFFTADTTWKALHNFRGHPLFRLQCEWPPQRLCNAAALSSTNPPPRTVRRTVQPD